MSEPVRDNLLPRDDRWSLGRIMQRFGSLIALALLVAFIIGWQLVKEDSVTFLSAGNLLNILKQQSFVGIIALGMTFVIILGGIDLSVGSLVAFAGGWGILAMNRALEAQVDERLAVPLAFAVMIALGLAAGALNGAIITFGRVAPFIATLGGLAAYRSLAKAPVSSAEYRSASAEVFGQVGQGGIPLGRVFEDDTTWGLVNAYGEPQLFPWPVLAFIVLAIGAAVLLRGTRYGRYVIAIGCNERAAVYSAVPVRTVKMITYTLSGLACGVAALLESSRMNSISSGQHGQLYELDAIAAVVIGGTSMRGGSGTIWGTVIGVILLGVINNALSMVDVDPDYDGLVKGLIIVAAVLVQRLEQRG